jgi:hypothetical protein
MFYARVDVRLRMCERFVSPHIIIMHASEEQET